MMPCPWKKYVVSSVDGTTIASVYKGLGKDNEGREEETTDASRHEEWNKMMHSMPMESLLVNPTYAKVILRQTEAAYNVFYIYNIIYFIYIVILIYCIV